MGWNSSGEQFFPMRSERREQGRRRKRSAPCRPPRGSVGRLGALAVTLAVVAASLVLAAECTALKLPSCGEEEQKKTWAGVTGLCDDSAITGPAGFIWA